MQLKHKLLMAFVLGWFALRTFAPSFTYRYMFTESILLLDAVSFIGVVYLIFERKKL